MNLPSLTSFHSADLSSVTWWFFAIMLLPSELPLFIFQSVFLSCNFSGATSVLAVLQSAGTLIAQSWMNVLHCQSTENVFRQCSDEFSFCIRSSILCEMQGCGIQMWQRLKVKKNSCGIKVRSDMSKKDTIHSPLDLSCVEISLGHSLLGLAPGLSCVEYWVTITPSQLGCICEALTRHSPSQGPKYGPLSRDRPESALALWYSYTPRAI